MLYKLDSDKESYKNVKMVTFKDINWKEENFENLLANNIKDFINTNELMM